MAVRDVIFYSISDVKEYLLPFRISGSYAEKFSNEIVLWSHNPDEDNVANSSIEERIRRFFINFCVLGDWYRPYSIIQFWAVKRIAGSKCFLTTTHQPFYINKLNKGYCSYRKECMSRNIDVGPEASESQLGPPGRAYRNGLIEICSDIRLYTIQEFPLKDHAILCGLKGVSVVAIPVFELDTNHIVGVLEFFCEPFGTQSPHDLNIKLKYLPELGLRTYYEGSSSESMDEDKYSGNIKIEMFKMFKEVSKTHPLALGLATAPCCKEYCLHCSGNGTLHNQIAVYKNMHTNPRDCIKEYNILNGMGVSGTAFASGKACFCRDIRNLSLSTYPYALYARRAGLTYSVATCVQSIQDKNSDLMVLEFFLLPGCYSTEYMKVLSGSLLEKIKEHLSSYKVADEDFPGEELFPETCDSLKHDEIDCVQVSQSPSPFSVTPSCGCDIYNGVKCYFNNVKAVVDFFLPNKLTSDREKSFVDGEISEDEEFSEETERSDHPLVLWSHAAGKCDGVEEHIKHVFQRVPVEPHSVALVQFWAPKTADRSFLTTFDQPFALGRSINKHYCLYRKECMTRKIYVDEEGNNEGQLGPAGRVFKNGVVECSRDVRLYTIEEFPLRDHAVLYGIKHVIWLPVFELNGKGTVGVLEILICVHIVELEEYFNCLTWELKKMGLRIDYVHQQPGESQSHAGIENMFEAISATHPLYYARALIPSQGDYCLTNPSLRCFKEEAYYTNPISQGEGMGECAVNCFVMAGRFPYSQDKYGLAGKALASRRSCFCMNICNLSIADYALAHYAKSCGFSFSVAICLQNTHCADKICVLEFFLLPADYNFEYIGVLLDSLLISVNHHLPPDFKIMSEDVPGEPFFLEIGYPVKNGSKDTRYGVHVGDGRETISLVLRENIHGLDVADRPITQGGNVFGIHVVDGLEATPLVIQGDNIPEMHVNDGSEATPLVREGDSIPMMHVSEETGLISKRENICRTQSSMRQLEGNKFHISIDELKHHFGKPLDKVAEELGVSRSTLKRIRKSYGIQRWPSHKKNKANRSLYMNRAPHIEEDIMAGSSRTDSARPVLQNQTSTPSTCDIQIDQHRTVCEVAKFVTIKASYGNDVLLKFKLNIRSSLEDLQNEVAKRLKVQAGRCSMKYEDEDRDWVSITIDEDLEGCLQTMLARGQTTIRMSVHIS